MVLACEVLFSFSIVYILFDFMSCIFCTPLSIVLEFLKISSSQLYIITSASYKVVIYLKSFALWLVENETLDAYTIPKFNELCREKLITVILDYESAYLGLAGEVKFSQEVTFIRGIVCDPTIQISCVCIWIRNSVIELLSLSLRILKNLLIIFVSLTFLQDIYLYYPIDWIPLVYIFRN